MNHKILPTLGHIVFYVRNLQASSDFYTDIVGLKPVASIFNNEAVMLTAGSTHHELLLIEVGDAPALPQGRRLGLYHVGWKVGDSIEELKTIYQRILDKNIELDGMSDHTVSQSLYIRDPDGNEIELYVDNPAINWQQDLSWIEQPVKPLNLA